MKILYLMTSEPDCLSDAVFYGLRKKYGADVIDYPRKDCMYQGKVPKKMYGNGFTLWGMLPNLRIDRSHVQKQLYAGKFDLIIFSDIYRQQEAYAWWTVFSNLKRLKEMGKKYAFIDGADDGHPTTVDAFNWGTYFKRDNPYNYPQIKIIGLGIPECKILKEKPVKTKMFARFCQVDEAYAIQEVAENCSKVRFEKEEDYYNDFKISRYGLAMKKSGWDTPRLMECASQWGVNCIFGKGWDWDGKTWDQKPAYTHPVGLKDMENCIVWYSVQELASKILGLEKSGKYDEVSKASHDWVMTKTCEKLADYVMENIS